MRLSKQRLSSYLLLLLNTVVWGAAFIVVKPSLSETTPFRFLFYRFLLASLLLLPLVIRYLSKLKISWGKIAKIGLLELVGTSLNLGLLYLGLQRTSAIETSLLATTAPVFTILLGVLFLKEREEKHEVIGLLFSLVGMFLITLLPLITNGAFSSQLSLVGNFLIIGATISESAYYIMAKKLYYKLPKLFVASLGFIVGAISFGVFSLAEVGWSFSTLFSTATAELQVGSVQFAVGYMAILGSIIGLTAYIKGQENIEASEAILFRYLQPAIYLPLGVILLQETVSIWQVVGLALVVAGLTIAQRRRRA